MQKIIILAGFLISYFVAFKNSAEDIRTMHVKMSHCIAFMLVNLFLTWAMGNSWQYCIVGLLPAVFVQGANLLNDKKIGNADFYLLIGAGVLLGLWGTLFMFLASLLAGTLAGMILLRRHPSFGSCFIPFIPFLSFFYLIWTLPMIYSQIFS